MRYHRVRDNQGVILDGHSVRLGNPTEHLDGQLGVTDIRFVNDFGCYRRIIGDEAQKTLDVAREFFGSRVTCGGFGRRVDYNLYDVPLDAVVMCDPNPDCLERS